MKRQLRILTFLTAAVATLLPAGAIASDGGYLSVGYGVSAITRAGALVNWNDRGVFGGIGGKVKQVVVDENGSRCVLRPDGTPVCEGLDYGQLSGLANSGLKYQSIAFGIDSRRACGVTEGGKLNCYGSDDGNPFDSTSPGGSVSGPNASVESFSQVSMGYFSTCALTTDGHIRCWGRTTDEVTVPASDPREFIAVSAGTYVTCGILSGGRLQCWSPYSFYSPPEAAGPNSSIDTFSAVSIGYNRSCGLKTSGGILCWGTDYYGVIAEMNASTETFGAIAAGNFNTGCATTLTGHVRCFGSQAPALIQIANSLTQLFATSPPDFTAPVITVLGANPLSVPYKGTFVDPGATAFDAVDGDLTSQIVATGAVNLAAAGTYTRTYAVSDAVGNRGTATRSVIVQPDTTPPILTLLGPGPMTIEGGSPFPAGTATAFDPEDGDVTWRIAIGGFNAFQPGTQTVTYTVTDLSGNSASAQRIVTVVDTTPPTLTVPAGLTRRSIGPSGLPVFFTARASDLVDPAPRVSCNPPSGSLFYDGDTTVTCTATDFFGNAATRVFVVHVAGAAEQIASLRAVILGFGLEPLLSADLLNRLASVSQSVGKTNATPALKQLESFMRVVVKGFLDGQKGLDLSGAYTITLRAIQLERALGLPLATDGVNDALITLLFMRNDMIYYGVADTDKKLSQSLELAMLALINDKPAQAVNALQAFTTNLDSVAGFAPDVASLLVDDAVWTEMILGFSNANPNAWYAIEILQYTMWDAEHAGFDRGLTADLVRKLVRIGREIAGGSSGCAPMQSALDVLRNALASGRVTADQADYVRWDLYYLQSLMGC